jgi:hypothetical protein
LADGVPAPEGGLLPPLGRVLPPLGGVPPEPSAGLAPVEPPGVDPAAGAEPPLPPEESSTPVAGAVPDAGGQVLAGLEVVDVGVVVVDVGVLVVDVVVDVGVVGEAPLEPQDAWARLVVSLLTTVRPAGTADLTAWLVVAFGVVVVDCLVSFLT